LKVKKQILFFFGLKEILMSHPLDFIPASFREKAFWTLLILTLILLTLIQLLNIPLQNPVSPMGIVSFELAGTPEKADAILQSWDARAQLFAAFSLGLDYLFLFAYGLIISLGVLMVAEKHGGRFSEIGKTIGWGVLLASLLDAIENLALWRLLSGWAQPHCAGTAAISAIIKFGLLLLGMGFAFIGWVWKKK